VLLHTLSALPGTPASESCLALLAAGDALLLMGDGAYAALAHTDSYARLAASGAELYVLDDDAAARGIGALLGPQLTALDMDGFVELTERYPRQQAWY
jgi:tRNA 2-thiouridine synthesizing protein B